MKLPVSTRLTGIALVTVLVLLPLLGWYISEAFRSSVESSFDRHLRTYGNAIAGLVHLDPQGAIEFSRLPAELRFEQVFSGWYWEVLRDGRVTRSSRSLWDEALRLPPAAQWRHDSIVEIRGPRGEPLRARLLSLQLPQMPARLWLVVAGPTAEIEAEVRSFNRVLLASLGSLGLILVLAFSLQLRWGLAPLRGIVRELRRVRTGRSARFEMPLPRDLRAVADALNEVLEHQEQLIARGRSVAGNLAHALKTPLASMRVRLSGPTADAAELRLDLDRLQQIVDHHLTRASAAGSAALHGRFARTPLLAAVTPVFDAIRTMYRGRSLHLQVQIDETQQVMVDPHDLQELVGNIVENAAKYAKRWISVTAEPLARGLLLSVDDDGPGIPEQERRLATERGARLDERRPGSGLGLAIVADLAAMYRIDVQLAQSALGGLRVELRFPPAYEKE